MSTGPIENEVKIRLTIDEAFPALLLERGFQECSPRAFEANTLYDTHDGRLQNAEMMLRIRESGKCEALLTWKGPGQGGTHKSRPEVETTFASPAALREILTHLGFVPVFRYEKFRTEYRRDHQGVVTFDETPIGRFLELEGPADWINSTAQELGLGPERYILESYGKLYQLDCEARGVAPAHMVFEGGKTGTI